MHRNRVGAFVGTTLVLLIVSAVLLAGEDLWNIQARAVGGLLEGAGLSHEVVTDIDVLDGMRVGAQARDARAERPTGPVVRVPAPSPQRPRGESAAAVIAVALALGAALASSKRMPTPLKGLILVVLWVGVLTIAYAAWWSALPPLDVRVMTVDWRTSALVPICAVTLLFAYDIYPLPGSFVLKTVWLVFAVVAVAVFSTVRLALVASGYSVFGSISFFPLFQFAGAFWDAFPGLGSLAVAHASVAVSAGPRRRFRWLP